MLKGLLKTMFQENFSFFYIFVGFILIELKLSFIPFLLLAIAMVVIDGIGKNYLKKLEEQKDERNTF